MENILRRYTVFPNRNSLLPNRIEFKPPFPSEGLFLPREDPAPKLERAFHRVVS